MHINGCVADFFLLLHLDTLLYICRSKNPGGLRNVWNHYEDGGYSTDRRNV